MKTAILPVAPVASVPAEPGHTTLDMILYELRQIRLLLAPRYRSDDPHSARHVLDSVEVIKSVCATSFGTTVAAINSRRRDEHIVLARWFSMHFSKEHLFLPQNEIARIFDLDARTISYAFEELAERVKTNRRINQQMIALTDEIERRFPITDAPKPLGRPPQIKPFSSNP